MSDDRITRTDRDGFDMNGWASAPTFPGTPEFSGHVLAQEKRGQEELVGSTRFPTNAPTVELEALGFTFGPADERDPLFRPAQLPDGWRKEGSDHDMWSYVLDEKGRRRVAVFYKAAFYDRDSFAHMVRPTSRLDDLIYGDSEPATVALDDLLTADLAIDYLAQELVENGRRLDSWAKGEPEYVARHERIRRLLDTLPEAGGVS